MSRFSTISSQHSALRDLERQRLERKMGQLRREIEGVDQAGPKTGSERRFKPPRRKQHIGSRCSSANGINAGAEDDGTRRHGPAVDVSTGDRAQSVEIAWLWSASSRMQDDAEKVAAFLTKHGLDRYGSLLAEDPSGLGSSLEALAEADNATLERIGMPASPRQHLLDALRQATPSTRAESGDSRPHSVASALGDASRLEPSEPSSEAHWGRLGRVPSGWRRVATNLGRVSTTVVHTADASTCCESSVQDLEEDVDSHSFVPSVASAVTQLPRPPSSSSSSSARPHRAGCLTSQAEFSSRPDLARPSSGVSRPVSAASRPGSSCGTSDRVSCYQCYKQVFSKFAIVLEDVSCSNCPRQFCSEACVVNFKEALLHQQEREQRLSDLRASVLRGGEALGHDDAP